MAERAPCHSPRTADPLHVTVLRPRPCPPAEEVPALAPRAGKMGSDERTPLPLYMNMFKADRPQCRHFTTVPPKLGKQLDSVIVTPRDWGVAAAEAWGSASGVSKK